MFGSAVMAEHCEQEGLGTQPWGTPVFEWPLTRSLEKHVPSLMDRLSFKIAVFIDLQKSNSKHPDWKRARPRTGRLYSRGLKPPITSSTARQWHREMSVQSPKDTKRQQPPSFSLITLPPSRKRCRSIRDHNTRLQSRSVPQAVRLFMS